MVTETAKQPSETPVVEKTITTATLVAGRIRVSHEMGDDNLFCINIDDDTTFTLPYWNIQFYFVGLNKKQVERAYDLLQNRYDVIIDTVQWKLFRPGPAGQLTGVDFTIPDGGAMGKETAQALKDLDRVYDLAEDYMSKNKQIRPLGM